MDSKTSEQTPEGGRAGGSAEGSLGEQLRRARESRGVTLREVSEQTRITMRHLEAIEADDLKALPGGIFNKSFVKSYARHVGFPEAGALELYERTARDRGLHTDEVATSPCGRGMTWTLMSSPTRRAAAAPASVAALTAPTSPRTKIVT